MEENMNNLSQLDQIQTPHENSRYLIVDLSNFNKVRIDHINNIVHVDAGCTISNLNQTLNEQGYDPLFEDYYDKLNIY